MGKITVNYLETDERLEAINSLQMVAEQVERVAEDFHSLKWVIIALHNAVQGFMVLALHKGNNFFVIKDHTTKHYYDYITGQRSDEPINPLDNFLNLYSKIKNPDLMQRWVNGQPFSPGNSHDYSMEMLNDERNDFIHFLPKSRSIEISGLPQMVQDCMDIIKFLSFDSQNMIWHDEKQEIVVRELIDHIETVILPLIKDYEIR